MSQRYFEDPEHARLYAKYRTVPPPNLIKRVIGYLEEKARSLVPLNLGLIEFVFSTDMVLLYWRKTNEVDAKGRQLALDFGCGSGQNTNTIAPYFFRVVGLDISEAQILEARKKSPRENAEFMVSPAEAAPFSSSSAQLVTSCVACHWFNLPNFYKEVERLLVKNGVAAFYAYTLPSIVDHEKAEELNEALCDVIHGSLGRYWGDGIRHLENHYKEIDVPFSKEVVRESFISKSDKSLSDVVAMVTTFSAYQTMKRIEGNEAVEAMTEKFQKSLGYITSPDNDPHMPPDPVLTAKQNLNTGFWNVRTMNQISKTEKVVKEMRQYLIDIFVLSEIRWSGNGLEKFGDGYAMAFSGHPSVHRTGVGLLMSPLAHKAMTNWNPVNECIMTVCFVSNNTKMITNHTAIIACYAPTNETTEEEKDAFYNMLNSATKDVPRHDILCLVGDLNAKVDADRQYCPEVLDPRGMGEINENGTLLINYALSNDLIIGGSMFDHKTIHKYTW
ncbi:hypothetical protein QYM36_011212, partial [Artemia franciscana]